MAELKIVKPFNVRLVKSNEFSKQFRDDDREIDVYLAKAYDEDTTKHCLIASIPEIKELSVGHIQFPFVFDGELERDKLFYEFDCNQFLDYLINQIRNQINEANENEKINKENEDGSN